MASVNARARAAGKTWERDIRTHFRGEGFDIESLRLSGRFDEGDHAIRLNGAVVVVEAKNEKSINLSGYMAEAVSEADNFAKARGLDRGSVFPVSVVKKRGTGTSGGYVDTSVDEFVKLIGRLK